MADMYSIAPQMKFSDKSWRHSNPHLLTEIPRSLVVRENVEYQGRYGLQNYDVVWVCLSFQLRDHLGQLEWVLRTGLLNFASLVIIPITTTALVWSTFSITTMVLLMV